VTGNKSVMVMFFQSLLHCYFSYTCQCNRRPNNNRSS